MINIVPRGHKTGDVVCDEIPHLLRRSFAVMEKGKRMTGMLQMLRFTFRRDITSVVQCHRCRFIFLIDVSSCQLVESHRSRLASYLFANVAVVDATTGRHSV